MNRKEYPEATEHSLSLNKSDHRYISDQKADQLYKVHLQGAYIRIGSCLFIWMIIFSSFLFRIIQLNNFIGLTACVFFVIVINPPTLVVLKRVRTKKIFFFASVLISGYPEMGDF
jgi:hypothetical protein